MLWLEQNLCLSSASIQRKKTNWLTPIAHSSNPSLVFHPQTSQLMSQRKFCVRESVPGRGSSTGKAKCIHGIISAKKNPDVRIKKKKEDAAKKAHVRLNHNWHCNVMFADDIRTDIATWGGNLTAAEQTARIKQGEVLHRKFCEEHNNCEKHNEHAHPNIMKACKEDPSIFNAPLTW